MALHERDQQLLEGIREGYRTDHGRWAYRRMTRMSKKMHRRETRWVSPMEKWSIWFNHLSVRHPWLWTARWSMGVVAKVTIAIAFLAALVLLLIFVVPRAHSGGPGPANGPSQLTTSNGSYIGSGISSVP